MSDTVIKLHAQVEAKPVLLFAYGNKSRGDDALAPLLLDSIKQQGITQTAGHPIKFLTDYQIQVEHVMDLQGCERILIIDAHKSLDQAYKFYPVLQRAESLYTTHGMSPQTLLHTYVQVFQRKAPMTSMMAIQGSSFELGEGLSYLAQLNLRLATEFIKTILQQPDFSVWDEILES